MHRSRVAKSFFEGGSWGSAQGLLARLPLDVDQVLHIVLIGFLEEGSLELTFDNSLWNKAKQWRPWHFLGGSYFFQN